MMNRALTLVVIVCCSLILAGGATAQEISFRGKDVLTLAHVITVEARRSSQIPTAFRLPMATDRTMVITAPNAFELLVRATIAWRESRVFPATVPLLLDDLNGQQADPTTEPRRAGLETAILTNDVSMFAPSWLAMIQRPGHLLPRAMTFETGYKLTGAQILVAMAVLMEETRIRKEIPATIAIPLVYTPTSWLDTRNPLPVVAEQDVDVHPPQPQVDFKLALNTIDLTEKGPMVPGRAIPPFCGVIRVDMSGTGPIAKVVLSIDGVERESCKGAGPYAVEINSLLLPDGVHTLTATAVDTGGKTYAYIFSFSVQNGRQAGFTPAEMEEPKQESEAATPA